MYIDSTISTVSKEQFTNIYMYMLHALHIHIPTKPETIICKTMQIVVSWGDRTRGA